MARLRDSGEKKIVSDLIQLFDPSGANALGDDCAMLEQGNEYLLMTTDMVNGATHVPKGSKPEDVGWYSAAVNLSDIAAMGGEPVAMLFAFGLPGDTEKEWLEGLAAGIRECCVAHKVRVLGGDTKESPTITITGTAFGRVPKAQIFRRSGARPGDILAMTGALGRGLLWEKSGDPRDILRINPRVEEGRLLAESGAVTSCIDMSDGLSTSLHHLARAGKVGFSLEYDSLPLFGGLKAGDWDKAMHWGGDYELLFTVDPAQADALLRKDFGCGVTIIGQAVSGKSITLLKGKAEEPLPDRGYEHFGRARQ